MLIKRCNTETCKISTIPPFPSTIAKMAFRIFLYSSFSSLEENEIPAARLLAFSLLVFLVLVFFVPPLVLLRWLRLLLPPPPPPLLLLLLLLLPLKPGATEEVANSMIFVAAAFSVGFTLRRLREEDTGTFAFPCTSSST